MELRSSMNVALVLVSYQGKPAVAPPAPYVGEPVTVSGDINKLLRYPVFGRKAKKKTMRTMSSWLIA
jgi:hypothetical protein